MFHAQKHLTNLSPLICSERQFSKGAFDGMERLSFPAVYDIAFQFRNAQRTGDFIDWGIARYADIPVTRVVDIACGTGHYLQELAGRGYETVGIDFNPSVCRYAEARARTESLPMTILCDDMAHFTLPEPCDLGINFFDSLTYLTEPAAIDAHFEAAARALNPGGLYIIEFGVIDHFENHNIEEVWTESRHDISVTATYMRDSWINPRSNTFEEQCSFSATNREQVAFFQIRFRKTALTFQEFETFVHRNGCFTPIAYYDDFDPEAEFDDTLVPWRVIAVLRRNE
jgi:SAM-dependent methyltransferase